MDIFVSYGVAALIFVGVIAVFAAGFAVLFNVLESKNLWPYRTKRVIWPTIVISILAVILAIFAPAYYAWRITEQTELINSEHYVEKLLERNLCALYPAQELKGSGEFEQFFSSGKGSFVIESKDVYRYYYESYGTTWPNNVPMYETGFKYIGENETPKLIRYREYDIETYLRKDTEKVRKTEPVNEWYYYIFYVPEGSIIEEYKIG